MEYGYSILMGIFAAALLLYIIPLTETDKGETVVGAADWMAELPDELPLNQIVIPGTHDSATQFVTMAFFGKCQSKSIPRQLESGFQGVFRSDAPEKIPPEARLPHGCHIVENGVIVIRAELETVMRAV